LPGGSIRRPPHACSTPRRDAVMTAPTYEALKAQVGSTFHVEVAPAGTALLTLTRCTERQRSGDYLSYTVTFTGSADQPLAQGTFRFVGDGMDAIDIFIVPITATTGTIEYEAVFNELGD